MGKLLEGLLRLQSIERDFSQVRRRLKARQNAVAVQQKRIDQLQENWDALHEKAVARRKDADRFELELRHSEEQVSKYRTALNTAKTNKDYAAILTQINTLKADSSKHEDAALKIIQEVDAVKLEGAKVHEQIELEKKRLGEIEQTNSAEIAKLKAMVDDLAGRRAEAVKGIQQEALGVFERVADKYDGEAMAVVEVHGKRPPHEYVCGGCYMTLNAEHANALKVRDEVRTCDNCGRILYMDATASNQG
jgi:predicted  nucleic acid-binding Zn-ribbon protein